MPLAREIFRHLALRWPLYLIAALLLTVAVHTGGCFHAPHVALPVGHSGDKPLPAAHHVDWLYAVGTLLLAAAAVGFGVHVWMPLLPIPVKAIAGTVVAGLSMIVLAYVVDAYLAWLARGAIVVGISAGAWWAYRKARTPAAAEVKA